MFFESSSPKKENQKIEIPKGKAQDRDSTRKKSRKKEDHKESKRNVEKKQEILSEEEGCNWETFDPGQKTVFEQEQRQNDSWKREKKNSEDVVKQNTKHPNRHALTDIIESRNISWDKAHPEKILLDNIGTQNQDQGYGGSPSPERNVKKHSSDRNVIIVSPERNVRKSKKGTKKRDKEKHYKLEIVYNKDSANLHNSVISDA